MAHIVKHVFCEAALTSCKKAIQAFLTKSLAEKALQAALTKNLAGKKLQAVLEVIM